MICKNIRYFFYASIISIAAAAAMLLTSCPNNITVPVVESGGYFNVDLVLIGSEDGAPYTKEISFNDSVNTVTVEVSYLLETLDIEMISQISGASLKVNGHALNYGKSVTVTLDTGTNSIPVRVTPDLVDPFNYTLVIKRGVAPGVVLSDDATLSSLSIDVPNSLLHPEFTPKTFEYTATVNYTVSEIMITAESSDENSDIVINGEEFASGDEFGPVALAYGSNNAASITITAEDEITTKTYTLEIFRSSVQDTEDPVITLIGGSPYYLEVYSEWSEPGYSAHDGIEGDLTAAVKVAGIVDTSETGSNILTYYVSDTSGNSFAIQRRIDVRDTTSPVITLNGANPMRVDKGSDTYTEPGAEVTDNYDTDLSCVITGSVDTTVEDTYQVKYSAMDSSRNTTEVIRNVVVSNDNDNEPPVIMLLGDNPCRHEVNTAWKDPGYSATDTVDGNLTASVFVSGNIDVSSLGTTTLDYDVSDSSGNEAVQQSRTVIVEDTTAPEISLIGADEINHPHGSVFDDPGVTITDNYDTGLSPIVIGSVNTGSIGTYPLLYRVWDTEGNGPVEISRIVHVTDQTPPHISIDGETSITVPLGGTFTEPWASGDVTASDNVDDDGELTALIEVSGTVDTEIPGEYLVYYNVSDSAGLSADTVMLTVTVKDLVPPVITLVGSAYIEVEFGEEFTDEGADVTDNWDNDGLPWHITSPDTVDTGHVGDYILTYNASDSEGNPAVQVMRTVIVLHPPDTIAPVISLNGEVAINIEAPDTYEDEGAEAYDYRDEDPTQYNITEDITVTVRDEENNIIDSVNYELLGTYTITYYVEDQADPPNWASVTRTVIVQDTTAPTIELNGLSESTVAHGSTWNDPGVLITDNYDTGLSPTVTGSVDTDSIGTYTLFYSVSDSTGNGPVEVSRTVHVTDQTPPEILYSGSISITVPLFGTFNEPWATGDITASDNVDDDGLLTALIEVTGTVDTGTPGDYPVHYDVTDSAGLSAERLTLTVSVKDLIPPFITLAGPSPLEVEFGSEFTDPGADVTDNYDNGGVPWHITSPDTVDTEHAGDYILRYNASDSSNNPAVQVTRTVTVLAPDDEIAPEITLNGDSTIYIEYPGTYTESGATATDRISAESDPVDISDEIDISGTVNTAVLGEYLVVYYVEDQADPPNSTSVTRTVIVRDTTAPVITISGSNPLIVDYGSTFEAPAASATDNYDDPYTGIITVTDDDIVITAGAGVELGDEYEIEYSTTDSNLNPSSKTLIVRIADTSPPVITLNGDSTVTVSVGEDFTDLGATVTDNYDEPRIIFGSGTVDTSTPDTYTLLYIAIDDHSNISEMITRTVIVEGD